MCPDQSPNQDIAAAILARDVTVTYVGHGVPVNALAGVDLQVSKGEFVCVLGRSGSGKSTLLHVFAALQYPTSGEVRIGGVDVQSLSLDDAARWRRRQVGMVHQFFNLIPTLSVVQNVATPLLLEGQRLRHVRARVEGLLDELGMADRRNHSLGELSGGEMQRVALARALVADPSVILADEPTGNLDSRTGHMILALLARLARDRGVTLVMVTHDLTATSYAERVVTMEDGRIVNDLAAPQLARPVE